MLAKLGLASALLAVSVPPLLAQPRPGRISGAVDEAQRVALAGNVRPEVRPENDRGRVPDALPMRHMLLQLKRAPEQERELQALLRDLESPGSPRFHRWLSAREFGERFGPSAGDLAALTAWLAAQGFEVHTVYPSGMLIDFSGSAGQVRRAFQTEIHYLAAKNELHIANVSEPRLPAALAPLVAGVVSLHDFRPHPMHRLRKPDPQFTFSGLFGDTYAVVPADLATVYNLNPLFAAGISGQGQSITLIEDTDVFSAADWATFRSTFGLSAYPDGSFSSLHPAPPSGPNNCGAPGVVAPNDAEAILDAEWASAAAPSARIEMAACADTGTTFGGLIALENLINSSAPPSIVSISYGQCETVNGAAANAAYASAYQQAVAEGVSVFVASGDSGAAGCDNSAVEAVHGIGVNAFASTPYNVAVGGTDFSDTFSGTNLSYWNSTNTPTFGSAVSYIPEIPWNDSCAGALVSAYLGYSPTYGPTSLCNDPFLGALLMSTVAGGGGPSQCASGTPATSGVVGGSCAGWAKPSWQAVLGNPADGVRDTPDVSLFSADGLWSHYYVFCWSDAAHGGAPCGSDPSSWSGAGGTSFASPVMAGIQALVNQKAGGPQGNPAPVYYQLAAAEFGAAGNASCDASNGANVDPGCIFYDVTDGDIDVDCAGPDCYLGGAPVGVLSTSSDSFRPAYGTSRGWDFATGIGSVNAANLVNHWPAAPPAGSFTLSASPATLTVSAGGQAGTTITVEPANGFNGSVALSANGLPQGVNASFVPASTAGTSLLTFSAAPGAAAGTFGVTVSGKSGSLSSSTVVSLTVVNAPDFTLTVAPASLSVGRNGKGTAAVQIVAANGFSGAVAFSASGMKKGTSVAFSPNPAQSSTTLTVSAARSASVGTVVITVTGTSGALVRQTTFTLTVHR